MGVPPSEVSARPVIRDANAWRREPSKVGTPARVVLLCFGSIAAMAPWPALGILLLHRNFDAPSEGFALFGGVTLLPLLALTFLKVPMGVIYGAVVLVWLAVAVAPDVVFRRRFTTGWSLVGLLAAQSAFSLVQAAFAAMLIAGKSV